MGEYRLYSICCIGYIYFFEIFQIDKQIGEVSLERIIGRPRSLVNIIRLSFAVSSSFQQKCSVFLASIV